MNCGERIKGRGKYRISAAELESVPFTAAVTRLSLRGSQAQKKVICYRSSAGRGYRRRRAPAVPATVRGERRVPAATVTPSAAATSRMRVGDSRRFHRTNRCAADDSAHGRVSLRASVGQSAPTATGCRTPHGADLVVFRPSAGRSEPVGRSDLRVDHHANLVSPRDRRRCRRAPRSRPARPPRTRRRPSSSTRAGSSR